MPLIVEDGTAKANADSYISAADAAAYLVSRGDTSFASASTTAQEAALRQATDFMLGVFRFRWHGYRYTTTQALDWPRIYVPLPDSAGMSFGNGIPVYVNYDVVPVLVQQACADLALRAMTAPLAPDIARIKQSVQIGPLKVDYAPYAPVSTAYVAVYNKLAPFLQNPGGGPSVGLVRA